MRALIILSCLALGACNGKSEPSFDERYTQQSQNLGDAADKMEAELDRQFNASAAGGRTLSDPNAPPAFLNEGAP